MIEYIKKHEARINELLNSPRPMGLEVFIKHHNKKIAWLQHERLVHLITMMFVCLFFLLSFGFTILQPSLLFILLTSLLCILFFAYVLHYYKLENSVQRWYDLAEQLQNKADLKD